MRTVGRLSRMLSSVAYKVPNTTTHLPLFPWHHSSHDSRGKGCKPAVPETVGLGLGRNLLKAVEVDKGVPDTCGENENS